MSATDRPVGAPSRSAPLGTIALYAALAIGALIALFPMLWMVSASLMPTGEATSEPPRFLPSRVTG